MTDEQQKKQDEKTAKPKQYQPPKLQRWGTLRELTQGGGGTRTEASTKRRTRF